MPNAPCGLASPSLPRWGSASVSGTPLQVRIGIATGLVVIGEPIGTGNSRQQTAVGETPNLAARLQSLAGPGEVVIDAATRQQIGGLFSCRDLGAIELKGLPAAVPSLASAFRKSNPRPIRGAAFPVRPRWSAATRRWSC